MKLLTTKLKSNFVPNLAPNHVVASQSPRREGWGRGGGSTVQLPGKEAESWKWVETRLAARERSCRESAATCLTIRTVHASLVPNVGLDMHVSSVEVATLEPGATVLRCNR